jgi:hypothetical protein
MKADQCRADVLELQKALPFFLIQLASVLLGLRTSSSSLSLCMPPISCGLETILFYKVTASLLHNTQGCTYHWRCFFLFIFIQNQIFEHFHQTVVSLFCQFDLLYDGHDDVVGQPFFFIRLRK